MEKVGIVSGDITEPELGLSENDKRLIFNEVRSFTLHYPKILVIVV